MPRAALSSEDLESFRDRLCEVATRRFAAHGYEGVTLRALARELGVSPMTPYRYFADKGAIWSAVRARAFARFADRQEEALGTLPPASSDDAEAARARLARLARAYLAYVAEDPAGYRLMFDRPGPDAAEDADLAHAMARAWTPLRRAVARGVETGAMEGDPDTLAHLCWAAVHGLAALELAGALQRGLDLDVLTEPMTAALLRGAAPRKETP
jgi:AcrR family transcriptional regulator